MMHTGYVSRCISESPSYGYLNRSMLASTRICNNSICMDMLAHDRECASCNHDVLSGFEVQHFLIQAAFAVDSIYSILYRFYYPRSYAGNACNADSASEHCSQQQQQRLLQAACHPRPECASSYTLYLIPYII